MLNFCWFCFLAVFIHHFQVFVCLNFRIFRFSVAAWVPTRPDCLSFMMCLDFVHSIHTFSCSLFRIVSHDVSFPEKMDTWLIDQPYNRATTEGNMPKYAGCGYCRRLFLFCDILQQMLRFCVGFSFVFSVFSHLFPVAGAFPTHHPSPSGEESYWHNVQVFWRPVDQPAE